MTEAWRKELSPNDTPRRTDSFEAMVFFYSTNFTETIVSANLDFVDDAHVLRVAENSVAPVEMRRRTMSNEELRAFGVFSRTCHSHSSF